MSAPTDVKAMFTRGTPVLHWPNGDRERDPDIDVIAVAPFPMDGMQMVRLMSNYRHVPVEHIKRHQLAAEIGQLTAPQVGELEFPPPPCARCDVDTQHDGDCHVCPMCNARWSEPYSGTYPCVECGDHDAEVEGADGQPRCWLCETLIRADEEPATTPYNCKQCGMTVYGIGEQTRSGAYRAKKCGQCQHAAEQREWLDSFLESRAGAKP